MQPLGPDAIQSPPKSEAEVLLNQQIEAVRLQAHDMIGAIPLEKVTRLTSLRKSAEAIYQLEGQPEEQRTRAWLEKNGGTVVYLCTERVYAFQDTWLPPWTRYGDSRRRFEDFGYDIDRHFRPCFSTWGFKDEQRLALYQSGLETVHLIAQAAGIRVLSVPAAGDA